MKHLLTVCFVFISLSARAQGTDIFGNPVALPSKKVEAANKGQLNHTDAKGLKQGPWEKFYQNGRPAYNATFRDDKPVGIMTRYYPSGKTKVRIDYGTAGETGNAEIFNENGNVIARGLYRQNQKDSIWVFYYASGEVPGAVSAKEQYKMGIKHGKSTIFYPNGRVAEEVTWADGKKEGLWLQFYESGKIKMESGNRNDNPHGPYKYYFENGKQEVNGLYQDGLENGNWTFYKEDGKFDYELEFEKGSLKNSDAIDKRLQEQLQNWEQNKDKLRDPEKLINDPDAMMLLR
ncbi:MAG: toxin-antitoxin system YwqK family antitoxin [Breznakibacter sp.]